MYDKNNQAFWLVVQGEAKEVFHVNTLVGFANHLIKDGMAQNAMRFITSEKKRYIEMWTIWCKAQPDCNDDSIIDTIVQEILSGYTILHRKSYVHVNMPKRPLNSRYTQRLEYRLKKCIEEIIKS
jgi:hypothetical protein